MNRAMGVSHLIVWGMLVVILAASSPTLAADRVVVIPLNSSKGKPLAQVVTVSSKNGDFRDPVAALNSITDASSSKPYVVVIGPGRYSLNRTVAMKPWVSLYGAGQKATILSFSSVDTAVTGADNCELADLTIDLNGSGQSTSTGMDNSSASPRVHNVRIRIHDGTNMYGLYGVFAATEPVLEDVSIELEGISSSTAYGIYNYGGGWNLADVHVRVNIQSGAGVGFYSFGGGDTIDRSDIAINGTGSTSQVTGVEVRDSGSVDMRRSNIAVTGPTMVYGLYSKDAQSVTVTGTELDAQASSGSATGMHLDGNTQATVLRTGITASASVNAIGLIIYSGAQLTARQITLTVKGSNYATGFMSDEAAGFYLDDATFFAQANSGSAAYGLDISGSSDNQEIGNCIVSSTNTGINAEGNGLLTVSSCRIDAGSTGVSSKNGRVFINHSYIDNSQSYSLLADGSSSKIFVRFSQIVGTVTSVNDGFVKCAYSIGSNDGELDFYCQIQ